MLPRSLSDNEARLDSNALREVRSGFCTCDAATGEFKIPRQARTLESDRFKGQLIAGEPGPRPERIVTPESQLLAKLGIGSGRRIFVTGDAATGDGGSGKSEFTCQLAFTAASLS